MGLVSGCSKLPAEFMCAGVYICLRRGLCFSHAIPGMYGSPSNDVASAFDVVLPRRKGNVRTLRPGTA